MTLKNLFPNEFDLLQEDKGYIRTVFDNIEATRPEIVSNLNLQIQKLQERIVFLNDRIESNKFEAMALLLPANVCLDNQDGKTWAEKLKEWSGNKDKLEYIRYNQLNSYNYEDFVEKYITTTEHNKSIITEIGEEKKVTLDILNSDIQMIKNKIKKIEIFSIKELLSYMNVEQREKVFLENKNTLTKSHYFSIIRFLIVEGLIDETYWYYKGNFNVDMSETLKRNDRIYMKGLLEGKKIDVFLDVETPAEIIERLSIYDFRRFNIFNKNILKNCLDRGLKDHVIAITDSAKINNCYKSLVEIAEGFEPSVVEKYVDILLDRNVEYIEEIILECLNVSDVKFIQRILVSIVINNKITPDKLEKFHCYMKQNSDMISLIPKDKFDIFIHNIQLSNFIFENIAKSEIDIDTERIKKIEQIKAYKLNIDNLVYVVEKILEKNINYGYLISEVCKSEILKSTKEYIDNNFEDFINEYIDNTKDDVTYTNDEDILVQILLSDIDQKKKLDYIIHNETIIRNICAYEEFSELDPNSKEDCEIFMNLFSTDKIEFNVDNINTYLEAYWNFMDEADKLFVDYIYRNIDNENIDDIFRNNKKICNSLITSPFIEDRLFDLILNYADRKIINARKALSKERISKLIKKDLLEITDHNIEVLIDNSYYEELVLLVNSKDQNIENDVITKLISDKITVELVYMLINSNISTSNAIKLTNYIGDVILLKNIDLNKTDIIKNIINNGLSEDNIKFICENFDTFKLKDDFIECLEFNGKLEEMNNVYLNDIVMSYILEYKNITADIKISLIIIKIRNNIDACELKKYISYVTEISNIANLWDNKLPSLDNVYQEKIGQALIENKYAKKRKDGKLMVIKS